MQKFRFVVQQEISNTHTYRVISPTRNNFAAVNILSRDDIWEAVSADVLQERIAQEKAEANAKAARQAEIAAAEKAQRDAAKKAADNAATQAVLENTEQYKAPPVETPAEQSDKAIRSMSAQMSSQSDTFAPTTTRVAIEPKDVTQPAVSSFVSDLQRQAFEADAEEAGLPIDSTANLVTRARLESQGVIVKQTDLLNYSDGSLVQPVRFDQFSSEAEQALLFANSSFQTYAGRGAVVTSAYDSFYAHKSTSAHRSGDAFDLRTNDLSIETKTYILQSIQSSLLTQQQNRYYIALEGAGTDQEHIHIEVKR